MIFFFLVVPSVLLSFLPYFKQSLRLGLSIYPREMISDLHIQRPDCHHQHLPDGSGKQLHWVERESYATHNNTHVLSLNTCILPETATNLKRSDPNEGEGLYFPMALTEKRNRRERYDFSDGSLELDELRKPAKSLHRNHSTSAVCGACDALTFVGDAETASSSSSALLSTCPSTNATALAHEPDMNGHSPGGRCRPKTAMERLQAIIENAASRQSINTRENS